MEIYLEVLDLSKDEIINHPLLAYDESIYDYIYDSENTEIFSLFLALATRHIEIEEKQEENLKYLFNSIKSQLYKISSFYNNILDIDQLISSLEYVDMGIISHILYMIYDSDRLTYVTNLRYFISAVLELDFDEEINIEILNLVKEFINRHTFDQDIFLIMIENENWKVVSDCIQNFLDVSDDKNQYFVLLENTQNEEIIEYFS
jgi:hypothetical protein